MRAPSLGPALAAALAATACGGAAPSADGAARGAAPGGSACPALPPGARALRAPGSLLVQDSHTKAIQALALSSDGRRLATGGADASVRVWDTASGMLLRRVGSGGVWIGISTGVSLDAAGDTLAYGSHDGTGVTVASADLAGGGAARTVSPDGAFRLAPDGRTLAVGLRGLRKLDPRTGAALAEIGASGPEPSRTIASPIQAIAFDASGERVVAAAGAEIALVDAASWSVSRRLAHPAFASMADNAQWLGVDGALLAMRTVVGAVHLIPLDGSGAPKRLPGAFSDAAIAGGRVFTVDQTTHALAVWDAASGDPAPGARPGLELAVIDRIAVSADGTTLAALPLDRTAFGQAIRIVDAKTLRPLRLIEGRSSGVAALAMRPDGGEVVVGGALGGLARWRLGDGEMEGVAPAEEAGEIVGLSYPDRGDLVASSAGSWWVRVRDAASFRIVRQWNAHDGQRLSSAVFVPGTHDLITTAWDGGIRRWDLSGAPAPPAKKRFFRFDEVARPPGGEVGKVDFRIEQASLSPDGKLLALGGPAGKLAVVGAADGAVRWQASSPASTAAPRRWIGWTADGAEVLCSAFEVLPPEGDPAGSRRDRPTLRSFDAATGAARADLRPATAGPIAARGDLVALGGHAPRLLGWPGGQLRATIPLDQPVAAIAAHPTRPLFLFGAEDGATAVVTLAGKVLALLRATPDGEFVAATPEGAYRSSLDGARSVGWTFPSPLEAFSFEQFASRFERPDLIARRLAGDDVPAPAAVARPPRVRVEPVPRVVGARSVVLRADVASPLRVDRLRVFVNGRSVVERAVCAAEARVEVEVPLAAGRNRVTVTAYDADGFASNPAIVDVSASVPGRPELWTVAVGVSRYPKLGADQQLEFADDDARAIAAALAKQAGLDRPFAGVHAKTLVDGEATVAAVEEALRGLAAMRPDDLAVVFLAGHGALLPGGEMVLLTPGATLTTDGARRDGVGWSRIRAALERARGRVLVLLDACHSGHVTTEAIAPNEALAAELAAKQRSGVLVLAASRGSQLSYESGAPGAEGIRGQDAAWDGRRPGAAPLARGHGLFTGALLEALEGRAPDHDESGAIEIGELTGYVTERVRTASNGMQTPWVARREMFGDFMIAPAALRPP